MALGKIKADTLEHSTAGSLETNFVILGGVKIWAKFNGSTFGEIDSFNVSSFTDSGTGNYTVNLSTSFANANHSSVEGSGAYHTVNDATNAAGTCNIACYNSSHSAADESRVNVHSCGDMA